MKKITTFLLAMLLVFSLVACGNSEANNEGVETEAGTGEVNMRPFVAATSDFNGDFYPGWTNSTYDQNIRYLVWGFGLMTDNAAGEIIDSPLVTDKVISEDLLEWTFTLREGVTFHNGEALTASDVKFTYDFYMAKQALADTGGSSSLGDYIENITIDEAANSVTFTLTKVIFTTDMSVFYDTWIYAEDTITEGAAAAGQNVQQYVKTNISAPIGYGPYKITEYFESEFVRLAVFDDYIGDAPAIQEIIVKVTPSETELDQLLQGDVDLLGRTVEAEKIEAALESDNLTTNNYYRHGGGTMILHSDYEAFALTEVRQAFAYVFNRPKVIELFLGEYGISSQGPYSKNQWMMYDEDEMDLLGTAAVGKFEASLTDYDILDADGNFDVEANIAMAHKLLDAAVAKTDGEYANLTGNGTDGYKWKDETLNIKITYTEFWSDTYNLVWNDKYIEKLGFNVTLNGLDWPVMYGHWTGDIAEERQYHAYVGGAGYTIKSNPRSSYASDKIMPWGQPSDNGSRFSGGSAYTPAEWDQLLLDIENCHPTTGTEQYKELWREFIRTMNTEVPIIPVYSNNYYDLYSSDLENLNTNALWSWPKAIRDANWK